MKTVTGKNNNIYNAKGFTLVELLAVIVVLAIVGLIAVQAVLPRMDEARRQAFAIEANGLVKSAQQYVVTKTLTSELTLFDGEETCVSVATLVDEGHSSLDKTKYDGKVVVEKKGDIFLYNIYLGNASFAVINKGVNGGANVSIGEGDVEKRTEAFATQASC